MFVSNICRRFLFRETSLLNVAKQRVLTPSRSYTALPKRFYKKTGVVACDGQYEIILDHRKLKTPKGEVLRVDSEVLGLAVAAEWDAQHDQIQRSSMHLTSLCMTAQDNPRNMNKYDAVQFMLDFIETDTVLFYNSEEEQLLKLQEKEWGPVISWFCEKFKVRLAPTEALVIADVPQETRLTLQKHLLSYNLKTICGLMFALESLRSLILTLSCVERKISIEQAVLLSRLEEEFQTGYWGRVEWAHDLSRLDAQARLAAAILYVHLNSMSEQTKSKLASVLSPQIQQTV